MERATLWLTGTHAINDDIELFVEGVAARRESSQTPASYILIAGNAPRIQTATRNPANNHYNPSAWQFRAASAGHGLQVAATACRFLACAGGARRTP
jgi:hypothetical protein